MQRPMQLMREHQGAIALAIFISLLTAVPQLYFRYEHRADGVYQGIELLPDSPWSPRVREIMDGHGFGNSYYKDGKNDPYLFQPLGSAVVAYLGKALDLDINNAFLLSRFFLPIVAVFLLYGFVYLLTRNKLAALSSASVLLLAESILNPAGLLALLSGESPRAFLDLSRPVNPLMIYIPFFGFLAAFWLFYRRQDWRWGVASAALLGLNFYNYFYTWTYLYVFGGFLVLLYLVQKNWIEAIRVGSVFASALVLAIPYVLNLYRASQFPTYVEVGQRLGIIQSHAPLWIGSIALIALVLFLLGFPRDDKAKYLFGLALLLAPLLTMNQQLITGKVMQPGHYHWYFHRPIAVILVLAVVFYWLSRFGWDKSRKLLAGLIVVASIGVGTFVQAYSYMRDRSDGSAVAVERQKYGLAMQWLSANADKEAVVLAANEPSHLVTIYTPQNVFYHRAGMLTLAATRERLLDQLFTFYRLRGIGKVDAREAFYRERGYISAQVYGIYWRERRGSYEAIPNGEIDDILDAYLKTLDTPALQWFGAKLAQYKVEYVIWDTESNPTWQLQEYPFLKKIKEFGNLAVYQFIATTPIL